MIAIAPATDADPHRIDKSERDQLFDAGHLIGQFHRSELTEDGCLEGMPAPRGSAIVHLPDHEAGVCEDLVKIDDAPCVAHTLRAGSAIDQHDCRILLGCVESSGANEARVEQ